MLEKNNIVNTGKHPNDEFRVLSASYPDAVIPAEIKWLMLKVTSDIRHAYIQGQLPGTVTTRKLLCWCNYMKRFASFCPADDARYTFLLLFRCCGDTEANKRLMSILDEHFPEAEIDPDEYLHQFLSYDDVFE